MNSIKTKLKHFIDQNTKLALLLGIIAILGVLFFFIRLFFFNKRVDEGLEIIFNPDKLVLYKDEDKFGYLDSKGKVQIYAKYQNAGEFFNGYAAVQIDDSHYEMIDQKGETKFQVETDIAPIYLRDYRVWLINNKIYNDTLETIFEGNYHINYINYGFFEFMNNDANESGIVDYTGKIIYKWSQDYIQTKIPKNSFSKNGYYALISNYESVEKIISLQNGKELFTLEDPDNTYIREEDNNIFRIIDRSDSFKTKTWFYLSNDEISYKSTESIYSLSLIKHEEDILEIDYGPTYKNANLNNQYTYYNVKTGKTLEKPENTIDESLLESTYGYHLTTCDKLFGINKQSREAAKCTYDEIKLPEANLFNYIKSKNKEHIALLKEGSNTILYNMRKKRAIETFENSSVSLNPSSTFLTITQYENDGFTKKGIMMYNLLTHKSENFDTDSEITVGSNYFVANGKYYNTNLDMIHE